MVERRTLTGAARDFACFAHYVARRFIADGCLTGASALSYTMLLSLVPLTAIVLAIFSGFPSFSDERDRFLALLLRYFIPQVGEEAAWYFKYFATIAAQTTAVGVVALAVTAILLLATIEDQMHGIWRVRKPRPWLQRVLIYWAVLTLGPLLLGMSMSLSTLFESFARTAGIDAAQFEQVLAGLVRHIVLGIPFALEAVAFTLLYCLIPTVTVRWKHGLVGGLVAAAAIELLKIGFALYVARLSSYRTVYGTLAAIPTFLLWMYLAWATVLLGAVVAAALPQWRIAVGEPDVSPGGRQLGVALALLAELSESARHGAAVPIPEMAVLLGIAPSAVEDHLATLQEAGFVAATTAGGWVLSRALGSTTLLDLYGALRLPLAGGWREGDAEAPWQRRVVNAMRRVAQTETGALRVALADLLAEPAPSGPVQPTPIDLHRRRR